MHPSTPATSELSLWSSLRALPRPAWFLFFGAFLNKFGAFVVPFLVVYLTRKGYTAEDAGLAIGAYGAGHLLASLLGGDLSDRIGRRSTIMWSMFSGAAAMLLLSQADTLPAIMALAALTGLTGELYRPAASALLADLVPNGQRITAFSTYRLAFNAGWAFGPATAGFLAAGGFFWLFVGDAGTSVLFGLVALCALPKNGHQPPQKVSWPEAWRMVRRDHAFLRLLLAAFITALVYFQMASTFALHVTRLGFSTAVFGALLSLNGVLVVICELPLTVVIRRFPPVAVIATGHLLIGLGFACTAFAHTIPALAACVVIFTTGEMIASPVSLSYVADLAPAHMRGRYMGMNGLAWALALTVGPGLGMKLFVLSPNALWFTCGAFGVLAAANMLRTIDRKSESENSR